MATGARLAETWREEAPVETIPVAYEAPEPVGETDSEDPPRRWQDWLPAVLLGLAAAGWTGVMAWRAATTFPGRATPIDAVLQWLAVLSAPLALIGILYLLLRRTSRREARRFGRTAAAMRQEAAWLGEVLSTLSARIDENRRALGDHAQQLLLLGDDATARLGEISGAMRAETSELSRHSDRLEQAARGARGDIAMLLESLPRATAESDTLAQRLRDAGSSALSQALALDTALAALAETGRVAEDSAGGAAQRLGTRIESLESAAMRAGERMDTTGAHLSSTVTAALTEAAHALDEARRGIDAQGAAMLAMVDQGRVSIEQAGADSARALSERIDEIGGRLDRLAAALAQQDRAGGALVEGLDNGLAGIEQRIAAIGDSGTALTGRVAALGADAETLAETLDRGGAAADALLARIDGLQERLRDSGATLERGLPAVLDELDQRIARSRAAIEATAPKAAELTSAAGQAVVRLGQADAILGRQTAGIRDIGIAAEERLAAIQDQANQLESALTASGEQVRQLVDAAGPQLIEALLRVREAARSAADHAREAFAGVIPEAAGALGAAADAALRGALDDQVEARLAAVSAASEQAVEAAQRASERLMRQMLSITDTTALIETRLAEARSEMAAADEDAFAKRVALLIDALNSTAINVTGILAQDVADSAWAAYLKGDRGIFTRRAVRLLDSTEVREIQRLYDADAGFREQLNRYVHDFEALLRRVLASRDGAPLGITLLSSDMGKLYVALAQAIERLRA